MSAKDITIGSKIRIAPGKTVTCVAIEKRGRGEWFVFDDGSEFMRSTVGFLLGKRTWVVLAV